MACVRDVVKSIAQAGCVKGHRYNLTVLKNKYKYSIISYQYGIMVVFCTKAMCLYRIMLVPAALQTIYVGTGTHSLPRTEHCSTQYY